MVMVQKKSSIQQERNGRRQEITPTNPSRASVGAIPCRRPFLSPDVWRAGLLDQLRFLSVDDLSQESSGLRRAPACDWVPASCTVVACQATRAVIAHGHIVIGTLIFGTVANLIERLVDVAQGMTCKLIAISNDTCPLGRSFASATNTIVSSVLRSQEAQVDQYRRSSISIVGDVR